MVSHPIIELIRLIESSYSKEITNYFSTVKKKRSEKLYTLITKAKNEQQLQKELLFKKLFAKNYSDKNDYLWRNEIRVLKEVLEAFLISKEHEYISDNNEAYNQWLLIQSYDRMKYIHGISEQHKNLMNERHEYASYNYTLDAQFILLQNLHHITPDVAKRMEVYPGYIEACKESLKDSFAASSARINLSISLFNWLNLAHNSGVFTPQIDSYFTGNLNENHASIFYNNFGKTYNSEFNSKLEEFDKAIKAIEILAQKNKLFSANSAIIQMALGKELSANGYFAKAHEIFSKVKPIIDKDLPVHRTVFYVNYVINLVKNKLYKEALHTLEHEFNTDNELYENMLLQSRLLCYLYLKDTDNLSKYISYDLDAAPFPQNYMLKVIKSAYFYLLQEHDTALNIINSLIQPKYAKGVMKYYQPIALLYKKLYTISQNRILQKKWTEKDVQSLKAIIVQFEETCDPELKLVSIYTWIKAEINSRAAEKVK